MEAATTEPIKIEEHFAIKEFDIQEITESNLSLMKKQILEIPELPETKEQYTSVKEMHIQAKKLLPRIEGRRKEIKQPHLDKCRTIDDTAKKAAGMVQPLIELSGSRRAAWEAWKAVEKAKAEWLETEREAHIENHIFDLEKACKRGLEYNLDSDTILEYATCLSGYEISAVDFEDRTEEAEQMLIKGIADTELALENRKKFEAEQAEAARIKAEQEAEAKKLAEEKARLKAREEEQDRKKKIQKALDGLKSSVCVFPNLPSADYKKLIVKFENTTIHPETFFDRIDEAHTIVTLAIAEAKQHQSLAVKSEALEKEKAAIEEEKVAAVHAAIITERESFWEIAHLENYNRDHAAAITDHEQYKADLQAEMDHARAEAKARWEATEKAQIEAAERAKLIVHDKELNRQIVSMISQTMKTVKANYLNHFQTKEGEAMAVRCLATLNKAAVDLERDNKALV